MKYKGYTIKFDRVQMEVGSPVYVEYEILKDGNPITEGWGEDKKDATKTAKEVIDMIIKKERLK